MLLKILNGLFLAAFLLSAAVQYNDPDALPWLLAYLGSAAMCIAWYGQRLPGWVPAALLSLSIAWAAWLMPAIIGQVSLTEIVESVSMQTRAVEEAREISGLLLIAAWSLTLLLHRRKATRLQKS